MKHNHYLLLLMVFIVSSIHASQKKSLSKISKASSHNWIEYTQINNNVVLTATQIIHPDDTIEYTAEKDKQLNVPLIGLVPLPCRTVTTLKFPQRIFTILASGYQAQNRNYAAH